MAAARPAVAAVVQLREVAVVAPGAPREVVEAADVPRPEAAVEALGAPQEAEVGPLGALPREVAAETADVAATAGGGGGAGCASGGCAGG